MMCKTDADAGTDAEIRNAGNCRDCDQADNQADDQDGAPEINDWHEIHVDLPTTTTAEIYRIARIGERHSSTRYVVHWSPRDYTTGEPLPPEEASFQSRLMAIEYMVEVAPMAMSAPVMTIEAWLYDAEEFIASGRKRYWWVEIARFELVGTRGGDVLIEVPVESPN